ncbi:MAG: class I SAM-dependent methyltransferase [Candidatus Krumholzibacteriia bacterium]
MSVLPLDDAERLVQQLNAERGPGLEILEVGCGRFRQLRYPGTARLTGLDISEEQLRHNDRLQEKIHGDVQSWTTDRQWDVVVSIFLLEHVDDPRRALENMLSWTRPGGLLVVAVPNVISLKGLVTRLTPFAFHRWFYEHVYRRPYAIFPTTMRWSIAPRAIKRQLAGHRIAHEQYAQETFASPFRETYLALIWLLKAVALGRWRPEDSNYLLVVQRNATAPAGAVAPHET